MIDHTQFTSPFVQSEMEYRQERIRRGMSESHRTRRKQRLMRWIADPNQDPR